MTGLIIRIPKHPALIQRALQSRLKQLASSTPILAASLCSYEQRCGRPSCRCHHGGPLHAGQHITYQERGKTRSVYVPKDLVGEVRTWIARHRRLKEVLKEIHLRSVALVRTHSQNRRRKAGRLGSPPRRWFRPSAISFPTSTCGWQKLPDTRLQELCTYERGFLTWWGIGLYSSELGSRRQLDFELRDGGPRVLANLNRLADTKNRYRSTTPSITTWGMCRCLAGNVCVATGCSACCA